MRERSPGDNKIDRYLNEFDRACDNMDTVSMNAALESFIAAERNFYADSGRLGSARVRAYDRNSRSYDPRRGEELSALVSALMDCEADMKRKLTSQERFPTRWGVREGRRRRSWNGLPFLGAPDERRIRGSHGRFGSWTRDRRNFRNGPLRYAAQAVRRVRDFAGPDDGFRRAMDRRYEMVDEEEREEQDARIAQADEDRGRVGTISDDSDQPVVTVDAGDGDGDGSVVDYVID